MNVRITDNPDDLHHFAAMKAIYGENWREKRAQAIKGLSANQRICECGKKFCIPTGSGRPPQRCKSCAKQRSLQKRREWKKATKAITEHDKEILSLDPSGEKYYSHAQAKTDFRNMLKACQ